MPRRTSAKEVFLLRADCSVGGVVDEGFFGLVRKLEDGAGVSFALTPQRAQVGEPSRPPHPLIPQGGLARSTHRTDMEFRLKVGHALIA